MLIRRLKTVISVTGILLLILSAASIYVALQSLSELRPAEDYEDRGVLTFKPYAVYPVQVENTGSGRSRRMNPTRTVYMVYYRATDGSGYQWTDEVYSRDQGLEVVEAGAAVKRRVLSIPEDRTYITVEPEQTARSYTEGLRRRYTGIVTIGTLYILFYVIVLLLTKLVRRLRQDRTEDTEAVRFGLEAPEPKSRLRRGWIALLALFLAALLAVVFWLIGHRASDPAAPDDSWSEDGGVAPVNEYVPPVNEAAFADGGSFSDFIANFIPMTMIGRYQLMCGVPAGEWAVHVTVRDVETDEVLFERNYSAERE